MQIILERFIYLLFLAAAIILVVFIHFFSLKHTRRKALSFANFDAIEKVTGTEIISKNMTILYLRIAILVFIFLSLSIPLVKYTGTITDSDFILAIDASSSMMAKDILPNRLEAAKETAIGFIDNLEGQSNIGVVTFSSASYIEQLPTTDLTLVKNTIKNIAKKEIGGTDISNALLTSINLLTNSNKPKSIILLTDGQINTGTIDSALRYADDITIYTIGIGTEEGGEFLEGATSKIDEDALQLIANYTHGKYYHVESKEELEKVYSEIVNLKKGEIELNLTNICLIIAILLIILDWILINTRYRTLP